MDNRISGFQRITARRVMAAVLAVCMVFTMSPPITAAGSPASGGADSGEILLSGFATLPDEVREQSVPFGTSSVELNLPDTLEATAFTVSEPTEETAPPSPSA